MRAAVTAVRAVALAVMLAVLLVGVVTSTVDDHSHALPATDESPIAWENERVENLMVQHRCSVTGFGTQEIPRSALIQVNDTVRHVTFDTGWSVFTGERAGTLVAVCLDRIGPAPHPHDAHGDVPDHRH